MHNCYGNANERSSFACIILNAGLNDTIGDYGIKVNQGEEIKELLNLTTGRKTQMKKEGKEYALSCSWKNRAEEWSNVLVNNFHVKNDRIKYLHDNFTLPSDHIDFLKKLGSEFKPIVIYDIGANVLNWTKEATKVWPDSEIVLFDAVSSFKDYYLKSKNKFFIGVLGDSDDRDVNFYQNSMHPAGNSYYKEIGHENSDIIYPESNYSTEKTSTLSTVVKKFDFPMPDLIKFDVQGAELDIIKGSLDIINRAKYLIVEIQNTQYNKNAPLLNETVDFLQTNGWELLTQKPFCDNGPDGDYCFKKKIKIGVFNSFPFHYEMFGFILNYAKNNNYEVDIFTNQINDLGWIDFYRRKFNNFNIIDFNEFDGDTDNYSFFFVTTDDDSLFKTEWINDNVVCLNHYYKTRTPGFKRYLNVARFKDSELDFIYPCYPTASYKDKVKNNSVCVIGGGNIHNKHNIHILNRLESRDKITLNVFVRKLCETNISQLDDSKLDINFVEDIETNEMIEVLKQSSYVLINYSLHPHRESGISCSGSMQLALSTLCKPIITNTSNKYLQIENALEFDIDTDEPINIDDEINFQSLEQERNKYVNKFEKYIDKSQSTIYLRILSDGSSTNMEDWMETDKLSYMYNKPVILTKKNNFTHCIIINGGMPKLNINKNKVIGLSHEPTLPEEPLRSQVMEYAKKNMCKYFIGDKINLPDPFLEGQTFMFHNTTRFNTITKTKFCSIVISGKQWTSGHKYRHKLVEAILKTDLPIDIYGYGVETYKKRMADTRLKYSLENTLKDPFGTDPFTDYKFHICIENMVSNSYFSEKIVNPLLSNIIPIYYGCKQIDNYFDNTIKLRGNIEQDINLLKNIFEKQDIHNNNIDSDKILDKCNMFYNLHTFFDDILLKDETIIPKKIFQTWEHSNIEPEFQQIIDVWKDQNLDYEYIFHDAEQRSKFIQENFEENVANAYNKIIPGAYKCDLWRYCVLYIYGGFYADIDTLCLGKLNDLITENIDFIVPIDLNINPTEGEHNLACGFIGSVPKSPILLDAINRIVFNVENNIIPTSKLDFSGPRLIGTCRK